MALSFPPLQQNRTSSGMSASLMACGVPHADSKLAPESGITQHILVFFIGEICDGSVEADAVSEIVRSCEIEACVAWIAREAEPEKIAVAALPSEISRQIPVHSPQCRIQHDIPGVHRAAEKAAAGDIVRIEIVGR